MSTLLEIKHLHVGIHPEPGERVDIVRDVSMRVDRGEIVGLVGESGSGKSMTALTIMGLLPEPVRRFDGAILFDGVDLAGLAHDELRSYRGAKIAMVFQEPEISLNPVFSIGFLLTETLRQHRPSLSRAESRQQALALLALVALPDPPSLLHSYPHQLSGGQRQRVTLALALAGDPDLLVADEPTTALDVTLQAEMLALLFRLREELGLSILLITHDLSVVASTCDRVMVMYAGEIVESGSTGDLFQEPRHPYSKALLAALPQLGRRSERGELPAIPGSIPEPSARPTGCAFHPRCAEALPECAMQTPGISRGPGERTARCLLLENQR